jgi:hypothetical protein
METAGTVLQLPNSPNPFALMETAIVNAMGAGLGFRPITLPAGAIEMPCNKESAVKALAQTEACR